MLLALGSVAGASPAKTVSLSEDSGRIFLENADVALVFDRATGRIGSFRHHGRELLAGGGGYVQVAFTSRYDRGPDKWRYTVVRQEPTLVEIAFTSADPACPFDLAAHYVLRANEPGFYNYLAFGHDAVRSPGVHQLAQFNFCLRVEPKIFTWAAVDDERVRPFPEPQLLTEDRMVMDSTYLLPSGEQYSKYFYASEMNRQHVVHGTMGEDIGLWIAMPSHEHLNGGPEHQELTVHQTEHTPVLLRHATGAHYGAGVITSDAKDGSWSKVSAPWFVYVNTGPDRAALWADAKRRAAAEVAAWPYEWLDAERFQLRRGFVEGQLSFGDGRPVGNAQLVLAAHEENHSPLAWQQQWRGYRFTGSTDAAGRFAIGKVRPGRYDLYAWQPGSFGTFLRQRVEVLAGAGMDLGQLRWPQAAPRATLWQIGRPDRSAREFGFAEDYRQWGLWQKIAEAYPQGVTYDPGRTPEREWPFQMAVTQDGAGAWRSPPWRIQFENTTTRTGPARLTLGITAFEGKVTPQLSVKLNGRLVGTLADLAVSGATHRSGEHAGYQEREITFDAAGLRVGENILELQLGIPGVRAEKTQNTPAVALHWDCLRLEVNP